MKGRIISRAAISLLAASVFCLCQVAVASAATNSPNAKLCQKNGWQTVLGFDGTSYGTFANEEACVAYAAGGVGTLYKPAGSQIDCQHFGGTLSDNSPGYLWYCSNFPTTSQADLNARWQTLNADCYAEGGTFAFGIVNGATPPFPTTGSVKCH